MPNINNLAKHEMPREKLMEKGAENLKNSELLAILLSAGIEGKNVLALASDILKKYPMNQLMFLDFVSLSKIKGIGSAKACQLLSAFELTKRALEVADNNLPTISSGKEAMAQLQELRHAKKEHFVVLYLNARNQLVHKETISMGTINASLVHPREVFKPAIDNLSAGIIIAHNHPSGNLDPSQADLDLTGRLADAGKLMGIELMDSLIVTRDGFVSLK